MLRIMEVADADVDKALSYDVLAPWLSAMGDEGAWDGEFEPFFSDLEGKLSGKKLHFSVPMTGATEWMRNMVRQSKRRRCRAC